jgi:hypothetical protein
MIDPVGQRLISGNGDFEKDVGGHGCNLHELYARMLYLLCVDNVTNGQALRACSAAHTADIGLSRTLPMP